ncbi:proteinase [Capsulimonas corticalis]|uniref:Proteinase n=1 Tax=Capsulimonas corticalis TaxID=2219043 RepID=A0A402CQ01_9BACT|nr:pitrilysin family protein [Capsulimonas corticalis]BDI32868.1 proteinase [Capsulimonas corticalis]
MTKSTALIPFALLSYVLFPHLSAQAQKKVAPTAAATTETNRAEGKPTVLNGIRETTLPNGLTILTKEVHAAPVVYFSVFYHVGSINEQVGQTGMSHLMEHMMFKGTKSRGPGVISSTLQTNGADFNASTAFDRTEYHETLASDRLETAMQIESDRMVNSLYDEKQHQKEMTVVRSEYEAGENDPGRALSKAVRLSAYQVHPYRWETIGFRSDIENFTRDEMYAYYKNYYTPNNATVVIVGDIDTAKAIAMVTKYFGSIPSHPVAEHFITPEPAQEGERRVTISRAGTTPQVLIAYHVPGVMNPDRYATDVLETVLSGGRTSRFFQDLVQTGLTSGADAYDYGLRDPDLLMFAASAQPGHTNPEMEKALLDELEKLKATPITDEELTRAVNQAEAGYVFGKESVSAQGSRLGEDAMKGDWRYGEYYLQNLRKVTKADVQRVAQKYLVERNRTVGYFEPIRTPGAPVAPGGGSLGASPTTGAVAPKLAKLNLGDFHMSRPIAARPASLLAASAKGALPTKVVLDNGITVVVQENHATPTVSIGGALMSAGSVFDPQDKRGLADFTASQLSRGTQSRSLLDIAKLLEGGGSSVEIGGGDEYASLGAHGLSKNFDMLLDVLSDELRHPAFPADELEKARAQSLAGIEEARDDTGALADIAFHNSLYPKSHPYSSPTLDEQASVLKGLTRDDLLGFYNAHYAPDKLILTIVGDVDTQTAVTQVKKYFGDWAKKGDLSDVKIPTVAATDGAIKTIVIPIADKAQVDVRYGFPGGLRRSDPDFYTSIVLDTILGGGTGLASRLALSVRDHMGLVYGIYASDDASLGEGPFVVEFGSNPANVDKATAETMRQIQLLRDKGVTQDEVAKTVSYLTGSYAVTLSTNAAVGHQLLAAQIYGLGLDYIQKRNSYYKAVTVEKVNAAAKKYLRPGTGSLVISGTYTGKYASAK